MKYKVGILLALLGIAVFGVRGAINPKIITVDLDVDADYDGEITGDDDPIERDPIAPDGPGGGLIAIGTRSRIILRPCSPADWGTTAGDLEKRVELSWDNASKIAVFTTPTVGTGTSIPKPHRMLPSRAATI